MKKYLELIGEAIVSGFGMCISIAIVIAFLRHIKLEVNLNQTTEPPQCEAPAPGAEPKFRGI